MPLKALPTAFRQTILNVYGDQSGNRWLQDLPKLLDTCAERWSLQLSPHFDNLSYSYVAPALRADGRRAVLKAAPPGEGLRREIDALRHFQGHGAVEIQEADPGSGVYLMAHILPGTPLYDAIPDDDEATRLLARAMARLHSPAPPEHALPTVTDWSEGLARLRQSHGGTSGPLPEHLVAEAESRFAELLVSMAPPVVLHGDLHHWNLLAGQSKPWIVIDPKGVVGEPAYEVGALLRNPTSDLDVWPPTPQTLSRRLDILAEETGMDRARMLAWGMAQVVLSACWSVEDNEDNWHGAIEIAERLSGLDQR